MRGELNHAALNFSESWHDIKLAWVSGLIFSGLRDEHTPPDFVILGDSAFVTDLRATTGKIVRVGEGNESQLTPESDVLAAIDVIFQCVLSSERQPAEFGVRVFKPAFVR